MTLTDEQVKAITAKRRRAYDKSLREKPGCFVEARYQSFVVFFSEMSALGCEESRRILEEDFNDRP